MMINIGLSNSLAMELCEWLESSSCKLSMCHSYWLRLEKAMVGHGMSGGKGSGGWSKGSMMGKGGSRGRSEGRCEGRSMRMEGACVEGSLASEGQVGAGCYVGAGEGAGKGEGDESRENNIELHGAAGCCLWSCN